MSVNSSQTNLNQSEYFFIRVNVSTLNVNTISTNSLTAQTITSVGGQFSTLSTALLYAPDAFISTLSTSQINLGGGVLTTSTSTLYFNGAPVVTQDQISSVSDWALYPAVSSVNMNNNTLSNANSILTTSITANMGGIKVLTSSNITASNDLMTNTLEASGLLTASGGISTTNVRGSGVTFQLGSFSTLSTGTITAQDGSISSLSVGTVATQIGLFSTLSSGTTTTGYFTAQSNATFNSNLFIPRSPDPFYGGAIIQGNHSPGFAITNYIDAAYTNIYGNVSFSNGLWRFYDYAIEAFANIDLHGGTLCNTGRIDTDGAKNLSIASGSNLLINSDKDTTFDSKRNFNITASNGIEMKATTALTTIDNGIGVGANSSYRINAKNGNRGYIEIKSDPGYAGVQGELHLIANGGSAAGYQTGGFVDIQANAGANVLGVLSYSRVGILADSITSYAGGYAPVTGTKGYNFINGSVGVNITAAAVSVVPALAAGSVYMYGGNPGDAGNSGGVKIQNGLSADKIQPYPDIFQRTDPEYDLFIKGNNEGLKVQLSNIRYMYSDSGSASGFQTINCYNLSTTTINGLPYVALTPNLVVSSITAVSSLISSLTVSSINGLPPGTTTPNLVVSSITANLGSISSLTVSSINGLPPGSGSGWVSTATSDLNMNGYNISSVQPLNINSGSQVRMGTPLAYVRAGYTSGAATSTVSLYAASGIVGVADNNISFTDTKQLTLTGSNIDVAAFSTIEIYTVNQAVSIYSYNGGVSTFAPNVSVVGSNGVLVSGSNILLSGSSSISITAPAIALSNVSSINGNRYTNGWVSTASTDLNMAGYNINTLGGSNLKLATVSQYLEFNQASSATTLSNSVASLELKAASGVNITSPSLLWNGSSIGTVTSTFTNLYTTTLSNNPLSPYLGITATSGVALSNVSSINGAPYVSGGGGGWVSTATTDLNMAGYNIKTLGGSTLNVGTVNQTLSFNQGSLVTSLTNTTGGIQVTAAAGSVSVNAADINLTGTSTTTITATSTLTLSGANVTVTGTAITLSNVSTINGVPYTSATPTVSTFTNLYTTTLANNPANPYLTLTATSSITLTASNALVFNSGDGNYFNKFVTLTGSGGSSPLFMNANGIYCQNGFITQIGELYFKQDGSITSFQSGGVNYLDINPPPTTGSGTGQLRFFGQKGNLIFDDNVALGGNGSNQIGVYNQYGYMYLDPYQNVYLGGGGSHRGGEDQLHFHGTTYADGSYNLSVAGVGFNHGYSNAFIRTRCDYGNYGNLSMNGYFSVCQAGTSTELFVVPSDTNQNMWYSNGTGGFGIGTNTPAYKLDVAGTSRATLGIVAGASDVARLILGPTPGAGNYDYCSLIQSESYVAGNYSSQLSFWTHPAAGNYGDPVRRMTIDSGGNVIIATGALYMSGNTIEMGGTSSNAAYISGLNHIYGNPLTAGGYFGGLIIDYMGALIWNGGGNNASIVVQNSSKVLFIDNQAADILIDSHGYGLNVYGAGVNFNTSLSMNGYPINMGGGVINFQGTASNNAKIVGINSITGNPGSADLGMNLFQVRSLVYTGGVAGLDLDAGSGNLIVTNTGGDINLNTTTSKNVVVNSKSLSMLGGYIDMRQHDILNVSTITNSTSNINITANHGINLTAENAAVTVYAPNGLVLATERFERALGASSLVQPVFQQGATSGSGSSGSVSVTIPQGYTTVGSYQVFVTHTDANPLQLSVVRNTSNAFTIYWASGGGGTQPFDWMTAGT